MTAAYAACVDRMLFKCQYAAFGGGAMLGVMYIGALKELCGGKDATFMDWVSQLKGVSGTSAGSLIAFLVSAGVLPCSMQDIIQDTDLGRVSASATSATLGDMMQRGALCAEQDLNFLLQELVSRVLDLSLDQARTLTLEDYAQGRLWASVPGPRRPDLCIVVTNARTGMVDFWRASTRPTVPLWLALRASASVPGLFPAVVWEGIPYIDGGVTCNLPCHLYPAHSTLSMFVHMGGSDTTAGGAAGGAAAAGGADMLQGMAQGLRCLYRTVQWYMCAAQLGSLRGNVVRVARAVPCVPLIAGPLLGSAGAFSFDAGDDAMTALVQDGARSVQAVVVRDIAFMAFLIFMIVSLSPAVPP